jgi:PadR family transcriptional regulator, regulatory protein PadR
MPRRLSRSAVQILHALAHGARHGFDIIERTALGSATVYPTLGKLEDAGLIASTWENPDVAHAQKRPVRRYYELRAAGRKALIREVEEDEPLQVLPQSLTRPKPGKN